MNEIGAKFKRQIEILGIAIKNTESLRTEDLARMYGVERLTIKRDLQELRGHGIDVHSEGKRGIRLQGKVSEARLQRIVTAYLSLSSIGTSVDKASALLLKKLGAAAISTVVALQMCIDRREAARITYESEHGLEPRDFEVNPLQLFQASALWRLLAAHQGTVKQFLMTKIMNVTPTGKTFTRPADEQIEEVFRYSFLSWTGGEKHTVRLRLSRALARHLSSRQLIPFETIEKRKDGRIDVSGVVNSLEELATWIVGQGNGIRVLYPTRLRDLVCGLAKGTLANY